MEDQVKALMHGVTNFETQKKEFRLLMDDYPLGDLDKIFEYTVHPVENNPVFIEEFYSKRNAEWMTKLDKMMHENPSFVAVGVSHFEGEKGLPDLMNKRDIR